MVDILIVGAGTAGLSAAVYGVRAGKSVLVLEQKSYGGQIVNSPEVDNYPGIRHISGFAFATGLYEQAVGLGAEYRQERVERVEAGAGKNTVVTERSTYEAGTVILATGAKNRPLGLGNSDLLAKEESLVGAGVSYCATCDGMFFRGKNVAVVGGGNTALEDAVFLSQYCNKVTLIHRRETFRGEEHLVERLRQKENVSFALNAIVTGLVGDGRLEEIQLTDTVKGARWTLPVSGLFVAIGQMPDNQAFANVVDLDEKGYVRAGEDCITGTEGIFAAGDCRTKEVRQLTTAAADGAVAALAACKYLGRIDRCH